MRLMHPGADPRFSKFHFEQHGSQAFAVGIESERARDPACERAAHYKIQGMKLR